MFCPQCGNEVASERVRFCTRCRFPLGSVKEFIVTEKEKLETKEGMALHPLRQIDINIGAGLMFIGALKFMALATWSGDNLTHKVAIFEFLLGIGFSLLLLFSQLTPRQRGLTLGATLMFLSSLIAILPGIFAGVPGFLSSLVIALPVILLWKRIVRALFKIFFDKDVKPEKTVYVLPQPAVKPMDGPNPALPPVQNAFVVEVDTNRIKKEEVVAPFSITEDTTEMLKHKQAINP